MKAKCRRCGDTVEVTKLREFKYCKCGAIALDYGDGENYYRAVGNPENFDGEIEDVPKLKNLETSQRDIDDLEPGSRVMIAGHEAVAKKACFPQSMRLKDFVADKSDRFWVEMAEHFEALAKLCEEKSREEN